MLPDQVHLPDLVLTDINEINQYELTHYFETKSCMGGLLTYFITSSQFLY